MSLESNFEINASKIFPNAPNFRDKLSSILDSVEINQETGDYIFADKRQLSSEFSQLEKCTSDCKLFKGRAVRFELDLNLIVGKNEQSIAVDPLGTNSSILSHELKNIKDCSFNSFTSSILHGFGALVYSYNQGQLNNSSITHLFVIVTNFYEAALAFKLYNLSSIIEDLTKSNKIVSLIVDTDTSSAYRQLFMSICSASPIVLSRTLLVQPTFFDETNDIVESWIEQPEFLQQDIPNYFGDTNDELNAFLQSHENVIRLMSSERSNSDQRIMFDDVVLSNKNIPVLVLASGPSLDESLDAISVLSKKFGREKFFIIASGSSIGASFEKNIVPDCVVILERDRELYPDFCTLDKSLLSTTTLIASTTIDPRLSNLFEKIIYFQRPLSSAICVNPEYFYSSTFKLPGPECLNAAVEFSLRLQPLTIYLVGADLGSLDPEITRDVNALGDTPRVLSIPESGRNGKTVWTSPELIVVKNSLELLLRLEHVSNVYSLGNGLQIDGSRYLSIQDFFNHFESMQDLSACDSNISYIVGDNLSHNSSSLVNLRSIVDDSRKLHEYVKQGLDINTSWSREMFNYYKDCIIFNEDNISPSQIASRRIFRQYISLFLSRWILSDYHYRNRILHDIDRIFGYVVSTLLVAEDVLANPDNNSKVMSIIDRIQESEDYKKVLSLLHAPY